VNARHFHWITTATAVAAALCAALSLVLGTAVPYLKPMI
jgi:hypothetical protein